MQNADPRDRLIYPTLTLLIDSYNTDSQKDSIISKLFISLKSGEIIALNYNNELCYRLHARQNAIEK